MMTINQFLKIIFSRKWLFAVVFAGVMLLVAGISLKQPRIYLAQAVIAVDSGNSDPVALTVATMMNGQSQNYLGTQASILASHNSARKVVESLQLTESRAFQERYGAGSQYEGMVDWLADILLMDLTVQAGKSSNTLTISYKHQDPKFAATIVNAFIEAYKRMVVESRVGMATQNEHFFQSQLNQLRQTLERKQKLLADYQRDHGLIEAPDQRLDLETQKLNYLANEVTLAQGELITAKSKLTDLSDGNAPEILANPVIQELTIQLAQQEKQLSEMGQKEGPNHPGYRQMAAQVVSSREQLARHKREYSSMLRSQVETAQSRLNGMQGQLDQQKQMVLDMKEQMAQLDIIRRGVENAKRNFDLVMQRWSESTMQANANMTNVSVLQLASPPSKPMSPKLMFNLLMGAFLAMFCAASLNYLLEWFDRKVRCSEDVERDLGIPVLITLGSGTHAGRGGLSLTGMRSFT